MSTFTLRSPALERAAVQLGMPMPTKPKQPAVMPQEAHCRRRAAVTAFHERLTADCPATFAPPRHAPPAALAVAIDGAIAERYRDVPLRTRRLFLAEYTRQADYLHRLTKPGAARLDLDGYEAGIVTEDQARHAAERLAARAAGKRGGS